MTQDFWVASGHHLTDRSEGGGLVLTDAFLKAFMARPELMPPDEACPVERGVHASLLQDPRMPVSAEERAAIADADARENLDVFLAFRDRLLRHPTLEAAYMDLFSGDVRGTPPLFLQQLTHLVARNAFDGVEDAFVLRAAECFFRPQRVSMHDGQVLLADEEAIASHEHNRHHSPLLAMLGGPAVTEFSVLNHDNASGYKQRSDAHDLVLNISAQEARAALGQAASIFIRHLTAIDIQFTPVERLENAAAGWFLAFDAEATRIANDVWRGRNPAPETMTRVLALYTFTLPSVGIAEQHAGKSGFALAAMSQDNLLTMKPQNLIFGLPLARTQG